MIEKYKNSDHYEMVRSWLQQWNIPAPDPELFSDCGFIVDKTAVGFLFKTTNSKTCYIDQVAADPSASKEKGIKP